MMWFGEYPKSYFETWNILEKEVEKMSEEKSEVESEKMSEIRLEVPGYGKEDITVNVVNDVLIIHGDNGEDPFEEKYNLHKVDVNSIFAKCKKGILLITFDMEESEFEVVVH